MQPTYEPKVGIGVPEPGGEEPPQFPVTSGPTTIRLGELLSATYASTNRNFGAWFGLMFVYGLLSGCVSVSSFAASKFFF